MEKKYKLIVAYDGTDYVGWQKQSQRTDTIAGTLEKTFLKVFGLPIHLYAASRTDAGVHACAQVASFTTTLDISPESMKYAWNNLLPEALVIRSLVVIDDAFYPRAHVVQKTYYYHFFTERPLPFFSRYGSYYSQSIDIQKLKNCLNIFLGTHDFKLFSSDEERENTIRTIDALYLEQLTRYNAYRIVIKGPGFLRHMIRMIVGACMQVASDQTLEIDVLKHALYEKKTVCSFTKAEAKGLMLYNVKYKL